MLTHYSSVIFIGGRIPGVLLCVVRRCTLLTVCRTAEAVGFVDVCGILFNSWLSSSESLS